MSCKTALRGSAVVAFVFACLAAPNTALADDPVECTTPVNCEFLDEWEEDFEYSDGDEVANTDGAYVCTDGWWCERDEPGSEDSDFRGTWVAIGTCSDAVLTQCEDLNHWERRTRYRYDDQVRHGGRSYECLNPNRCKWHEPGSSSSDRYDTWGDLGACGCAPLSVCLTATYFNPPFSDEHYEAEYDQFTGSLVGFYVDGDDEDFIGSISPAGNSLFTPGLELNFHTDAFGGVSGYGLSSDTDGIYLGDWIFDGNAMPDGEASYAFTLGSCGE